MPFKFQITKWCNVPSGQSKFGENESSIRSIHMCVCSTFLLEYFTENSESTYALCSPKLKLI